MALAPTEWGPAMFSKSTFTTIRICRAWRRCSTRGDISFPLLGDIAINGMTVKEVRATLVELLAKDYLVDPQVIVRVKEYRSQWVTVIGEVVRPGKYYLQGAKSMLELLTEAGGFTSRAERRSHREPPRPTAALAVQHRGQR